LLIPDDCDSLVCDGVVGQLTGRCLQLRHDLDNFACGVVNVGVVLQERVNRALVFPTLEDVPDRVGNSLPVVIGLVNDFEKGQSILCLFASARSETPWRDGERRNEVYRFVD